MGGGESGVFNASGSRHLQFASGRGLCEYTVMVSCTHFRKPPGKHFCQRKACMLEDFDLPWYSHPRTLNARINQGCPTVAHSSRTAVFLGLDVQAGDAWPPAFCTLVSAVSKLPIWICRFCTDYTANACQTIWINLVNPAHVGV